MMSENHTYWFRAIALWFLLMMAETLHALWRVKVLALWIGDAAALDVSVFTGSLVILLLHGRALVGFRHAARGRFCSWGSRGLC
jgi:hypothetical protein